MKLLRVQITNYRSISNTNDFSVGDVTCLVGKNESGKTNILKCIERLRSTNPKVTPPYDEDMDWPRTAETLPDPKAVVLHAHWSIEDEELALLEKELGAGCLNKRTFATISHFDGSQLWELPLDEKSVRGHFFAKFGITPEESAHVDAVPLDQLVSRIDKDFASFTNLKAMADHIRKFRGARPDNFVIDSLKLPEMLYFASYDRLGGRISIEDLINRRNQGTLTREHQLFLMFLDYAGVKPEELQTPKTAEQHISRLERAQNRITGKIFKYWSQNRELEVRFEAQQGRSQDPAPFNSGTVFHTRIYNRLHKMTVPFDERSAGFTWFFSFLVQFSQLRDRHKNLLILLDEPGGALHAKAQQDLLRFMEEELKPHHQVMYTTHSPFMVPAAHLERVRVVEDVVEEREGVLFSHGSKVSSDFLRVGKDTRFPLQGALGYEITQSLFVGTHSLLVEGPSDILYMEAASQALVASTKEGLDRRWTKCPSGGVNKVFAFVSLFAGNAINAAVFVDLNTGQGGNRKELDQLKSSGILEAARIFTAADFVGAAEADIEDMFGDEAYLAIVDAAYGLKGALTVSVLNATGEKSPRVVKKVEAYFRTRPDLPKFDHYKPAEFLILNPSFLSARAELFSRGLGRFEALFQKLNTLV